MINKSTLNQIISSNEPTVIEEFIKQINNKSSYQSEAQLEKEFIDQLISQGYQYLDLSKIDSNHHEKYLTNNLRTQIERLNNITFNDDQWEQIFNNYIANKSENSIAKTNKIHNDYIYNLKCDNEPDKNIKIIDKKNIHNNHLQIINQYINEDGEYANRYDVTILVNGLPLIHIELKKRGIRLKEAFNQISRYKKESFWAANGLFNYIQIFVISNGTNTKYYSNTTRFLQLDALNKQNIQSNTTNSFEFTNHWSDANNNIINDLEDFTKTFFAKHTILNILTKYCIFTTEEKLMVMRPYQIVATERIINKINLTNNYPKFLGTIDAGGYIWHTTGSGKTVTSFKTAQLIKEINEIDKVLFVVDRKDLDYQTMLEYDKFQKGAANATKSTNALKNLLEDNDSKIIITTIQKLSTFINKNTKHDIFNKRVVMIFDECHRSQFGQMHQAIINNFKKYNIFGFTGTPIFAKNASIQTTQKLVNNITKKSLIDKTTQQLFGDRLHTYTIIDAIQDKNVLKFKYNYVPTIKEMKDDVSDEKVYGIDKNKIWLSDERISLITKYIIEHFNQITYRSKDYSYNQISNVKEVAKDKHHKIKKQNKKVNMKGFNSIFAVSSVEAAKKYYLEFKKQLSESDHIKLNVATIFSYSPNEDVIDEDIEIFLDDENNESTIGLDASSKEFLECAIQDYNQMFNTNWSASGDGFQSYYKDVSMRMRNKEIDILIVVNMFLTGFDAPTLNTLWVDKWLKMHGLIQAFSRTNRILNSVKTHGNIVSFQNLQNRLNDAISLFSDNKASGIITLRPFNDYYNGYYNDNNVFEDGYVQIVEKLQEHFSLDKLISRDITPEDKKAFIKLFGNFLQIRNVLLSYVEEFVEEKWIINERELQDYSSYYQDFYDEIKTIHKHDKVDVVDDLVFEIDLIKQIDVDIDYIWNLVLENRNKNIQDKDLIMTLTKVINSSFDLRSKKELIIQFLEIYLDVHTEINQEEMLNDFKQYILDRKEEELSRIIKDLNLKDQKARKYIQNCLEQGIVKTHGTELADILNITLFDPSRKDKIKRIVETITQFVDKFFDI